MTGAMLGRGGGCTARKNYARFRQHFSVLVSRNVLTRGAPTPSDQAFQKRISICPLQNENIHSRRRPKQCRAALTAQAKLSWPSRAPRPAAAGGRVRRRLCRSPPQHIGCGTSAFPSSIRWQLLLEIERSTHRPRSIRASAYAHPVCTDKRCALQARCG